MILLDKTIQEQLKNGEIARLGNIGNFQLSINSNGYATEKQVNANIIKSAKINFILGKGFKEMFKGLARKKDKISNFK